MELDLGFDAEPSEPTILEYARFHGLCRDYSLETPAFNLTAAPSDEVLEHDLCDPLNPPILKIRATELIKERLTINIQEASLLHSIASFKSAENVFEDDENCSHRICCLKQEMPVLRTDHELDVLKFGSTETPNIAELRIPLEPLDPEKDEGLEWPEKYLASARQCDGRLRAEKLQVSKSDIFYLNNAVRNSYIVENDSADDTEQDIYRRSSALEPLTPPLLPLSPPATPYIPSSPASHLPILSDSSNSTIEEAKLLQEQIMDTDALIQGDDGESNLLLDITGGLGDSSYADQLTPTLKRKSELLHVETPLTPPIFSESPAKKLKTVTFSDIPQYINGFVCMCDQKTDEASQKEELEYVQEDWQPVAKEAKWRIEHERLCEADTTKRIDVPFIEFVPPTAPWDEYKRNISKTDETELHSQRAFLARIKRTYPSESWHGVSRLNRELQIEPFAQRSARVTIDEKLHGQEHLDQITREMTSNDIVTSSTDIWKRDGLRLLEQEDDEEEELERMKLPEEECMDLVTDNPSAKFNEAGCDLKASRGVWSIQDSVHGHDESGYRGIDELQQKKFPAASRKPPKALTKKSDAIDRGVEKNGSLMFGGKFSASSAMDKFIALHGMEVKPQKTNDQGQAISKNSQPTPYKAHFNPASPTNENLSEYTAIRPPTPVLPKPSKTYPSCSFIISEALLHQHHISRLLERLYPNAEFISRDFDLPYVPAQEADLVLSPSTGLILTTLQEIKQRALPGQPDDSKIKKRLMQLQSRYERLVVLVSESPGRQLGGRGVSQVMDARDLEAVEQFKLHASKLQANISVQLIPGEAQALTQSIVEEMAKHGLPHGSKDIGDVKLLSDETNWELFLRRVGLNPFAAQVILALLKGHANYPVTTTSSESFENTVSYVSVFGLQRFIMMSAQERVQTFQALLGGSRILQKVSTLLDQQWLSPGHDTQV
ncbi:hypothetical protein DM02DRAFT_557950 [Periconia macrospinosa]|uniref:Uncharacterized protein n=1 Tax=Periconia macrospinosa TaxID=97972 RepID=A0A2V1DZP3_9PLEO|nr:hypothetical protein DM02DRAFT_557950 [Periconia macrospinosa]